MIDREALRVAILEVAMRVMTFRAGGELIITKDDYEEFAGDGKHFHFEKNGDVIKFQMIPEDECTSPAHEQEASPRLFGPGGSPIQ